MIQEIFVEVANKGRFIIRSTGQLTVSTTMITRNAVSGLGYFQVSEVGEDLLKISRMRS